MSWLVFWACLKMFQVLLLPVSCQGFQYSPRFTFPLSSYTSVFSPGIPKLASCFFSHMFIGSFPSTQGKLFSIWARALARNNKGGDVSCMAGYGPSTSAHFSFLLGILLEQEREDLELVIVKILQMARAKRCLKRICLPSVYRLWMCNSRYVGTQQSCFSHSGATA